MLCIQDLKLSNIAVNEDCDLRVGVNWQVTPAQIDFSDPGLWVSQSNGQRDDRICNNKMVPGPRNYS